MKKMKLIKKIVYYVILTAALLLFLMPFFLVLLNSFKTNKEIIKNALALPAKFMLDGYVEAFQKMNYLHSFGNSLYVTLISVVIIVILSSMCAHFFARKNWKINKIIFLAMVASMIIPFQTIMIPLVKNFAAVNMMNSLNTVIVFYIGANVPLAVFMFHGFIKNIPFELEEAATVDGCTQVGVFFRIVLPMLKPIVATVVILDVLAMWNDFLLPFIIIKDQAKRTLPLTTYMFVGQYSTNYLLVCCGLVLTILPVIILYLFLQKHVIEGVAQGAIK